MSAPINPPSRILDIVAGPYALAVSQIWSGDRVAEYLTATDLRRHVWHACLASPFCMFSVARDGADFLYSRMQAMKSRDLIVQAYGSRPPGVLGVMRRLGPAPRAPEIYQLLVAAMENGGVGAHQLMHLDEPTDAWIETIAALPPSVGKRTVTALTRCKQLDPEDLALLVWTAGRLQQEGEEDFAASLLTARNPISELSVRLQAQPFPPPPWPGTPMLRPLLSSSDLIRVATEFNNCLQPQHGHGDIFKIINGTKHFYHWLGKEPAVIDLISLAGVGWFVKDAHGPNNCLISSHTRHAIARTFSQSTRICAARLTARSGIYPCGEFWGKILRGAN